MDRDFKHLKSYYPLYKKYNAGVVLLKLGKKDSTYWGIVKLLVNNWEDLKEKCKNERRPFVLQISSKGVARLEL
jgi:hypothetical protein